MYHIYQFDDQRDGTVIYIGLTNDLAVRTRKHLSSKGLLYPLAQELKAEGLELCPYVLESVEDLEEARQIEKTNIQQKEPLLNTIHNQSVIKERQAEEEYKEIIENIMKNLGLNYKDAVIFDRVFNQSSGDSYTYTVIKNTAQLTRQISGAKPFSESEILSIALKVISK